MNAARWWRLDRQLDLDGIEASGWIAALPDARLQLLTTFAEGATLASVGSAPGALLPHDTGPLQVCTWDAGGGASTGVLIDADGALLHEVTAPSADLARLVARARRGPTLPVSAAPSARPPDGAADASEVLELLGRAVQQRLTVHIAVYNRALSHAVCGEVQAVERQGELVLIDAGPCDLYLDLQRLGDLRLVARDGDLPDLEGVVAGVLTVSLRWGDRVH